MLVIFGLNNFKWLIKLNPYTFIGLINIYNLFVK